MNILLINHYAGSPEMGMEFRPYYFAREWVKMGHRVSIIAADYSHLRRKNPQVDKDFQHDIIDGIDYYWLRINEYEGNGARRALTMVNVIHVLPEKMKYNLEYLQSFSFWGDIALMLKTVVSVIK